MVTLQRLGVAHLSPDLGVYAALFTNVKNAAFLQRQLLQGNTDFEYALIDATCILSPTHILAAVFRATNDYLNARMKSKNIHSEIVFALSPNNNIAASFRTFGISPSTTDLLVIKISTSPGDFRAADVEVHLATHVEGGQVDFDEENVFRVADLAKIKKAYKLGSAPGQAREGVDHQREMAKEMEVIVLGMMALRGAT